STSSQRARRPSARWEDVEFATEEFPLIAERQNALEEAAARAGSPVLFCDTDSFATTVWHERYLGARDPRTERIAELNGHHLWLLTDHEGVAFEDDGLRDGEELRPWMTGRFGAELARTGRQFIRVSGSHEERLAVAVAAVDALLARGWDFAPPLPERR
uniref:AAA family ATPase n=1 Tax=Streptomyces lushanensis TaxID=1434255 RepID=UPI000AF806D9